MKIAVCRHGGCCLQLSLLPITIQLLIVSSMTMKLWTLAEISGELAKKARQISSSPDNNLLTLNNDTLCHLPYVFPFTDQSGSAFYALNTHEGLAAIALAAQHLNTGDRSIVPEVADLANDTCGMKFNVAAYDTEFAESIAVDQIIQITGSRFWSKRLSSVLTDEEAGSGSRRLSLTSNGSIAESDAVPVTVKDKLVAFGSSNHDDNENHTKMNADGVDE